MSKENNEDLVFLSKNGKPLPDNSMAVDFDFVGGVEIPSEHLKKAVSAVVYHYIYILKRKQITYIEFAEALEKVLYEQGHQISITLEDVPVHFNPVIDGSSLHDMLLFRLGTAVLCGGLKN